MKLGFIFGRAGSGKTHYIVNQICQKAAVEPNGPPVILLVPEQATFQMEYTLANIMPSGGSVRAQVLSFRRLAHRVLLEVGGAARIPIGELGKRMVLRNLISILRDKLTVFGKSAVRAGFTDCIARSIGELKTYLISPEMLAGAADKFSGTSILLYEKLNDLSLLYQALDDYMSTRYTDPDDFLKLLAENLPDSIEFRNATFWLDGFKGFTPLELLVIKNLFRTAEKVNLSLCIDCDSINQVLFDDDLFYPTWETLHKVKGLAAEQGVILEDSVLLKPDVPFRFVQSPEAAHLEKNYFRYPVQTFQEESKNLTLIGGANLRAEVENCAREIVSLIRDNGYRWKDVAVLVRNMEQYYAMISSIFKDYGIPFFIDQKRSVLHHPLVELIRSALETVCRNWAYEPVFRYFKTDLVQVDRDSIFSLENYVLARGIKGSRWLDDEGWADLLEIKKAASNHLVKFSQAVSAAGDARQMTAAVYSLLEDLGVAAALEQWKAAGEAAGNPDSARVHGQIWSQVIGLLDEVVEALGEYQVTSEAYAEILDAGFESMHIGLIPPGLDQVIIGTLDRSRSPQVKAVFLLGASEGVLPARPADDGLFNDQEREKLLAAGLDLAPGSSRQVFEEQFLVYTALTRASERLWISYPMADSEGRAITRSPVVTRIKELFPTLSETVVQVDPFYMNETENFQTIINFDQVLSYLAAKLRTVKAGGAIEPLWWQVYNWLMLGPGRDQALTVLQGVFHQNSEKPMPKHLSRSLYGQPVKASVSRIEKFRACPFAHFGSYGLGLKERKIYRLEAPDMGELFHAALQRFAEEVRVQGLDWSQLSSEDCRELNKKIVDELAPLLQGEILLSTARYRYLTGKLKKTIDRAALVLTQHARQGGFKPLGVELTFGLDGGLPPLSVQLPDGNALELRGRIDRLDMAETENAVYLRVIDYKSSDTKIGLQDIYHGLRIQLLTYLHVALTHFSDSFDVPVLPGGILYFTVKDPLISTSGPISAETAANAILNMLKMRGFLLADAGVFKMMDNQVETGYSRLFPVGLKKDGTFYAGSPVIDYQGWEMLQAYLKQILAESGEKILRGVVDIAPYQDSRTIACTYCTIKPVCKFDALLEDNDFRILTAMPPGDPWPFGSGEGDHHEQ